MMTALITVRSSSIPFGFFLLHLMVPSTAGLPVFRDYGEPDADILVLDLDQRSIVAQTALVSVEGLQQAKVVYEQGRAGAANSPERTLQSIGTEVYRGDTFERFKSFYGEDDYSDLWVEAALDGTNLLLGGTPPVRQVDFTKFNVEGRASAVRWGTVVLNVWMAVVGALEQSLAAQCGTDARQSWDEAFALYTGSEAEDLQGGFFLYNFAQIQCLTFGTCKRGDESPVNTKIIQNFVSGRDNIRGGDCALLGEKVQRIQDLMNVPLIQASLRSMYSMDREDDFRPEIQGEAAAFSAAVAPIVSMCSPGSADTIFNEKSPGNGPSGSFEVVKDAFERHYDCLGVSCEDVGGIITLRGDGYLDRAEACDGVLPVQGVGIGGDGRTPELNQESGGGSSLGLALGLTFGLLGFFVAVVIGIVYKKRQKEFDTSVASPEKMEQSVVEMNEAQIT